MAIGSLDIGREPGAGETRVGRTWLGRTRIESAASRPPTILGSRIDVGDRLKTDSTGIGRGGSERGFGTRSQSVVSIPIAALLNAGGVSIDDRGAPWGVLADGVWLYALSDPFV